MTAHPAVDRGDEPGTTEIVAEFALGCCGDAQWRGRYCQYHQGFEAGLDEAADRAASRLSLLARQVDEINQALDQYDTFDEMDGDRLAAAIAKAVGR